MSLLNKFLKKPCTTGSGQSKYKKAIICLTTIGCIASISLGYYIYQNTNQQLIKKVYKIVEAPDEQMEGSIYKTAGKIFNKSNEQAINEVMSLLENENIDSRYKVQLLDLANQYAEKIDYEKLMKNFFNNTEENLDDLYVQVLTNNTMHNEALFLKMVEQLDQNDTYRLWEVFNQYIASGIGETSQVYQMSIPEEEIVGAYLRNTIDASVVNEFTKTKNSDKMLEAFKGLIKSYISKDEYDKVQQAKTCMEKIEIGKQENAAQLLTVIEDVIELNTQMQNRKEVKGKLEENYTETKNQLKKLEDSIQEAIAEREKQQLDKIDYESKASQFSPFTIDGYIIQELGQEDTDLGKFTVYEAAYTINNNYYVNYSSDNRFLLITFNTRYRSKGKFSLEVIRGERQEVKLKEELGGFTNEWQVYIESVGKAREKYDSYQNKVEEAEKEIKRLTQKINENNKEKENIQERLKALESEILEQDVLCKQYTEQLDKVKDNAFGIKAGNQENTADEVTENTIPSISNTEILNLVANAEEAVLDVLYGIDYSKESDLNGHGIAIEKFNSKEKIIQYLNQYWISTYAEEFISTYGIKFQDGKAYIPLGDGLSPQYREGKVISSTGEGQELKVVIDCPDRYEEGEICTYKKTLIYENNKWVVKE